MVFVRCSFGTILTAVALAISIAGSLAKDEPKKAQCPTLDHQEIEDLLRKAPSCQRAIALFEICQMGSGGDLSFGTIVAEKCERRLSGQTDRGRSGPMSANRKQCQRKYVNESGTMYRSFEAFCGADVARSYSARFLTAGPGRK
jgi:hypothetical protein